MNRKMPGIEKTGKEGTSNIRIDTLAAGVMN